MPTTDAISKFLLELVAYGGGAAAVAYVMFQFLGKSWIEAKFAQRLEQHKHQQALELQRLRVEIDSMLSGAIKLQEREFSILPTAWQKLNEAHGLVSWFVSPLQAYPDLDRMSSPELAEFLAASELAESQKQRIVSSANKTDAYVDIIFRHRLNKVRNVVVELREFVASNGIFLPPDLKEQFTKVVALLWSALTAKQVGVEAMDFKLQTQGWEKIEAEIEPLYKSIEAEIQRRLRSHGHKN